MKETILNMLNKLQQVSLATCEGDQPRVRPMTLIVKEGRFFFATGSEDNKSKQLAENPKAEFNLLFPEENNTGYLRGSGTMKRVEDQDLRTEIADWAGFIYDYFKDATDPNYCLFELYLKQLSYMKPGDTYEETVQW